MNKHLDVNKIILNINLNNTHVYKRIFLQLKFRNQQEIKSTKTRILLHVVLVHRVVKYLAKNNRSEPMSSHFSRKTANNSEAYIMRILVMMKVSPIKTIKNNISKMFGHIFKKLLHRDHINVFNAIK